jgi:hypothetical protein
MYPIFRGVLLQAAATQKRNSSFGRLSPFIWTVFVKMANKFPHQVAKSNM